MKVYQINYDLRKQRNYDELYNKIMSLGNWCRPFESCWIVACNMSAVEIRDDLKLVIENDDELLITRLQNEAAWSNLDSKNIKNASNWLKENLDKAI